MLRVGYDGTDEGLRRALTDLGIDADVNTGGRKAGVVVYDDFIEVNNA